jgi:hypothetical protein
MLLLNSFGAEPTGSDVAVARLFVVPHAGVAQ